MAFKQLYYTSCETGLSGSAGYQFNAATPGVSPEVLRQVENLTSYQPPRSLPHAPTAGEIAACPVSLCYASEEAATIVANVVFTGADYSRRMGNYFAHALTTAEPNRDLDGILPIQLWHAPFWTNQTVDTPDLAELHPPLPAGPLDRATVEAFLDAHSEGGRLPALVTAAWEAVTAGKRSVVLVEPETQAAARWIAAISFLVPPAVGRALSFTTYHRRPSYCPLHVIGTIPDADIDPGNAALESFSLFDFAGGRYSNIDVHPLAALLTRIGVVAAEDLWRCGARLTLGAGASTDDWYPVTAAAAALAGVTLRPPEFDAAVGWAPGAAPQLGAEVASSVCTALLDQPEFDDHHLRPLIDAAGTAGASAILEELERRLVDVQFMQALQGGLADGDHPEPLVSSGVKHYAGQRCEAALSGASVDVRTALRVLGWASATAVPVADHALRACGRHTIGPDLLDTPPSEEIRVFASASAALRRGIADCFAAAEPDAAFWALARGASDVLGEQDVAEYPAVRELLLVSAAQRDPTRRAEALLGVLARRAPTDPGADDELLTRLWPDGRWPVRDALRLLEALRPEHVLAGAIPDWLSWTVVAGLTHERDENRYLDLCARLERHPVHTSLDEDARDCITRVQLVVAQHEAIVGKSGEEAAATTRLLVRTYSGASRSVQTLIARRLPHILDALVAEDLGNVLADVAEPVWRRFLEHVRAQLEPARPHLLLAARLFVAMGALKRTKSPYHAELEALLTDALLSWKRRDQEKLETELMHTQVKLGRDFVEWRDGHQKAKRRGILEKTFRRKPKNKELGGN